MKANFDAIDAARDRIASKLAAAPRARINPPTARMPDARLKRVISYVSTASPAADIGAFERAIGESDLLSITYFWAGLRAARSVGKISVRPMGSDRGGVATGFLVAPGLLLTNWHTFESKFSDTKTVAGRARVQFGYELDENGNERKSTWFTLAPDRFFCEDRKLDYAVVAIDPASQQGEEKLESFGWLRLNPQLGKADYGAFLSIIQHPRGETKQIAIRENELLPFDDTEDFLTYRSDTFRGSSGSPVFNDYWDVVALHHMGLPARDGQGRILGHDNQPLADREPHEEDIKWEANEGARVSRIVNHVLANAGAGAHREALAAACAGTIRPLAQLEEGPLVEIDDPADPAPARERRGRRSDPNRLFFSAPLGVTIRAEAAAGAAAAPAMSAPAVRTQPAGEGDALLFEKLNFDDDYSNRDGYSAFFLGREREVPMPKILDTKAAQDLIAPTKRSKKGILHYHHFSLMMHAARRMPMLAACNVDYRAIRRDSRSRTAFGKDEWIIDRRMDEKYQIPKGFYERWKKLDYGHLASREDNCWGSSASGIEAANADTFHLTNCTPQHETFNRAVFGFQGIWGRIEIAVSKQGASDPVIGKMCVFSGPIFRQRGDLKLKDEDGDVLVPMSFWKVVVAPTRRGDLRAYGFITSQKQDLADDSPVMEERLFEDFEPGAFEDEQATLAEIERRTVIRFDAGLKAVDILKAHPGGQETLRVESLEEFWTGQL